MGLILTIATKKAQQQQKRTTPNLEAIAQLAAEQTSHDSQASFVDLTRQAAAEISGDKEKLTSFRKSYENHCKARGVSKETIAVYKSTMGRIIKALNAGFSVQTANQHGVYPQNDEGRLPVWQVDGDGKELLDSDGNKKPVMVSGWDLIPETMSLATAKKTASVILSVVGEKSKAGKPPVVKPVLKFGEILENMRKYAAQLHTEYGVDQKLTDGLLEQLNRIEKAKEMLMVKGNKAHRSGRKPVVDLAVTEGVPQAEAA